MPWMSAMAGHSPALVMATYHEMNTQAASRAVIRVPLVQHPEVAYKGREEDIEGLNDTSRWRQQQAQVAEQWRQQEEKEIALLEAAVYASCRLTARCRKMFGPCLTTTCGYFFTFAGTRGPVAH